VLEGCEERVLIATGSRFSQIHKREQFMMLNFVHKRRFSSNGGNLLKKGSRVQGSEMVSRNFLIERTSQIKLPALPLLRREKNLYARILKLWSG
jgi:hypothetical protein